MKKLFVGNLPFSATEDDLRALFSNHGAVESVSVITDRETGRPRGFGFVERQNDGADKAIAALNDTEFQGRNMTVSEARARTERSGGGGGRGGYGGGGGRGGSQRDRW
jgi:RNA recognition motif-containing protein